MLQPESDDTANLIPIAHRAAIFNTAEGQTFAYPPDSATAFPIRSHAYREWFFDQCYTEFADLPTSHAFHRILDLLEGQAAAHPQTPPPTVWRRAGARGPHHQPSHILLHLADPRGRLVEISPAGWQVVANQTTPFQTSRSTAELPAPLPAHHPAAALETLRASLNLASRADWLRCVAWLLNALRPHGPFPFLVLQGPPGAGKTLAATFLRSLIDPSSAPLTPIPHNARHLLALARHNWVLAFHHVSALSTQLTDSLCRLTSGAGAIVPESKLPDPTRDPLLQFYRRPMIFTVTGHWSPPPEFAHRALTLNLQPPTIPQKPEAERLAEFSAAHAQILGALCTAVATALERLPHIHSSQACRHADAALWAVAAAPALGCTEAELQQALAEVPADPLVQGLKNLLRTEARWTGTRHRTAPRSCRRLRHIGPPEGCPQYLRNSAPLLAEAGIEVETPRLHGGVRVVQLSRVTGDASLESCPQDVSPKPLGAAQVNEPKGPPSEEEFRRSLQRCVTRAHGRMPRPLPHGPAAEAGLPIPPSTVRGTTASPG